MKRKLAGIIMIAAIVSVGLSASSVVPANASTPSVTVYWQLGPGPQGLESPYPCTANTTHTYDELPVLEIKNNCGTRVWLHRYNSNGTIAAYCVNPGGLAYYLPVNYTEIQVTANTAPCNFVNSILPEQVGITWSESINNAIPQWYTVSVDQKVFKGGNSILEVENQSDFRVWLHQTDNGLSGDTFCLSPEAQVGIVGGAPDGVPGPYLIPANYFWQIQVSANQMPCSTSPPPF